MRPRRKALAATLVAAPRAARALPVAALLAGILLSSPALAGAAEKDPPRRARAAPGSDRGASDDLGEQVAALKASLASRIPREPYIVVDTHKNMISYRSGDRTIHEALCSTGCDSVLAATDGRVWRFATPTGTFRVKRKIKNPTWVKPDWAYIEEGKPIPKKSDPDRFDDTAMGSYALDFGNGYFIHGTLYRRLLGENITHGCVRVADEDLAPIFEKAKVGTLVLIF